MKRPTGNDISKSELSDRDSASRVHRRVRAHDPNERHQPDTRILAQRERDRCITLAQRERNRSTIRFPVGRPDPNLRLRGGG